MSFPFHTKQKPSLALHPEPISIGCEAWVDVGRFYSTAKSVHHASRTSSGSSLPKSFADLRRKFRKSSDEDIG